MTFSEVLGVCSLREEEQGVDEEDEEEEDEEDVEGAYLLAFNLPATSPCRRRVEELLQSASGSRGLFRGRPFDSSVLEKRPECPHCCVRAAAGCFHCHPSLR